MADPAVTLRRATPSDCAALSAVLLAAFLPHRTGYTAEAFAATTPDAAEVRRRLAEGPVWVAVAGTAVVGTVSAVALAEEVYLRSMAVLPTARGHGVGEALVACVDEYARSEGKGVLRLSTTPFLHAAIRLYERCGFVRDPSGPHELAGTPLFTMVKALGALPGRQFARTARSAPA